MPRSVLPAAALLLLLSGCASVSEGSGAVSQAGKDNSGALSSYGLYLAGEAALNDGQNRDAQTYFDRARAEGADADLIVDRTFTAALLSGDVRQAAALAASAGDKASEGAARLGRLVIAVDAMASGKGEAAKTLLASGTIGQPHTGAAVLLAPWAAAMAGDLDGSVVQPEMGEDRVVAYFGQFGQAQLLERAGRYDEAETDFKALTSGVTPGEIVVLAYGGFLERRGRGAEAVALYDTALAAEPEELSLSAARARAAAKKPAPPMPDLKEGAAQALLAPAATMLAAKQAQLGLAYLRLVLRLDPRHDEAWLLLGDVLSESGDLAGARDAYSRPQLGTAQYPAAQAKLAWSYQAAGDKEQALKLARALAATGGYEARLTLADLLRANDANAESAELMSQLIADAPKPNWRLFYARAVVYEKLNRWPEAESDLQAALKLQPDEPELLNYLGYSWIDRGVRLKEATAMVERAVAANPRSGAMVDSLGWALYRQGDFKRAVERLEQAVELDAGDPEINSHLGDAYWRVGRRDEAAFQWRRVLTLAPDDKLKAQVEAKLAAGLGPDGPAIRPKIAGQ